MEHNFMSYSGRIISGLALEILYFPLWWYSVGLGRTAKRLALFWRAQEESLGFGVWAKNIFVPMYGQHDWAGRLISFLVRLVQVIFRGTFLLIWMVICLAAFILWLLLPPAVLVFIFRQITS